VVLGHTPFLLRCWQTARHRNSKLAHPGQNNLRPSKKSDPSSSLLRHVQLSAAKTNADGRVAHLTLHLLFRLAARLVEQELAPHQKSDPSSSLLRHATIVCLKNKCTDGPVVLGHIPSPPMLSMRGGWRKRRLQMQQSSSDLGRKRGVLNCGCRTTKHARTCTTKPVII
jgi:hypothetical protein